MKFKLLILTMLVLLPGVCSAQQNNWDESLDRYEIICERCLELKRLQEQGKTVPRESVTSLMTQLALLRSSLNAARGNMSAAQKARFDMIRSRISLNGNSIAQKERTAIAELSPISDRFNQFAAFDAPSEILPPAFESESTLPAVSPETEYLISAQAGIFPDFTAGLMLGVLRNKLGFFLRGRHDFKASNGPAAYSALSDGTIPGGESLIADSPVSRHRYCFGAGAIFKPLDKFALYAGTGYSVFECTITDSQGRTVLLQDISAKGAAINLGVIFFPARNITISAGTDIAALRYTDIEISIGIRL